MFNYEHSPPFRWLIRQMVLLPWTLFVGLCSPVFASGPAERQLVDMVSCAIGGNYSMIESAKLTMRETALDRSARDSKTTGHHLPDGRTVRIVRQPRSVALLHLLLRGNSFRCERRTGGRADGNIVEIHGLQDGVWTQYVPSIATGWIRLPDQLPSLFPMDPRESGSADIRRRIEDILKEDRIVQASMVHQDKTHWVRIVVKAPEGGITTYHFSAANRFLPTLFYTQWNDGSLLQLVEISYQPVLGGKALFPRRIRRRFYDKAKTQFPDTTDWRQEMVREVTGQVQCNAHIGENELTVMLPPATRVVNVMRNTIRGLKGPISERRSIAFPLLNILVIFVLFGAIVIRAHRMKKRFALT